MIDNIDPLFKAIINTGAFKRLNNIRFLGGIDYILVPFPNGSKSNVRYTRYQHSLGVGKLALYYANLRELTESQTRLAFAAGLLHDIGHAPLSHSLEPVFQDAFGIDHHQATESIIRGEIPLGKELFQTLKEYHIDIDNLTALINGEDDVFEGFFSSPINFDTIEAILRSRRYIKPRDISPCPIDIVRAATLRASDTDRLLVDRFWEYKQQVYKHIVRSRDGVIADYLCQKTARSHLNRLTKEDFFSTEQRLFERMPNLRKILQRFLPIEESLFLDEPIPYKMRHFYVEQNECFFERMDKKRYMQIKLEGKIIPRTNLSN